MPFDNLGLEWVQKIFIWIGEKGQKKKKRININMKWIISLFEIDILKIIHDYNPDKLILNLFPISLEPIHLGHRELRKN